MKNFKLSKQVIYILKQNTIEIGPTSLREWNYNSAQEGPKPDGTYDVMGWSSVDLQVKYRVNLLNPLNWYFLATDINYVLKEIKSEIGYIIKRLFPRKKGIKDSWIDSIPIVGENKNDSRLKKFWKSVKNLPTDIYEIFKYSNAFRFNRESWIFVVDSFDSSIKSFAYDEAEDIYAQRLGFKDKLDMFEKQGLVKNRKEVQTIYEELLKNKEPLIKNMIKSQNLIKIGEGFYVSQYDPTCMTVDEKIYKFNMRDGWNESDLENIIEIWARAMNPSKPAKVVLKYDQ